VAVGNSKHKAKNRTEDRCGIVQISFLLIAQARRKQ
jgi:hypothetical protein